MPSNQDFFEPLLEEVVTDLADSFFGARKNLDNILTLFQDYVEKCRQHERRVERRVVFVNQLLLEGKLSEQFYQAIGVRVTPWKVQLTLAQSALPPKIPYALTTKGRYTRLLRWGYNALQKICHEHLFGGRTHAAGKKDEAPVYYRLIIKLAELINDEIQKVNTSRSPDCVLSLVKGLDPGLIEKECLMGASLEGQASHLNRKMAFAPIDVQALPLRQCPELPQLSQVADIIDRFGRRTYEQNRRSIDRIMADLARMIKQG